MVKTLAENNHCLNLSICLASLAAIGQATMEAIKRIKPRTTNCLRLKSSVGIFVLNLTSKYVAGIPSIILKSRLIEKRKVWLPFIFVSQKYQGFKVFM